MLLFVENGLNIPLTKVKETKNLPAIAQVAGVAVNPKITNVARQNTIYDTAVAMGLPVKINAMKNVVISVPDMPTAGTVMSTIYQMFGIKTSLTITWDGQGKVYADPRTPIDKPVALAYAKQAKLPPPNFQRLLNSTVKEAVYNFRGKDMYQIILKWVTVEERQSLIGILDKGGFYEGWDDVEDILLKKKVPLDVTRAFIAFTLKKLGFA